MERRLIDGKDITALGAFWLVAFSMSAR